MKSFLEGFQFVLKFSSIKFDASLSKTWTTGFGVGLVRLTKNSPNSLPELVNIVERYAATQNKDILPRAQACIASDGGAFEYLQTEILHEKI